LGAADRIREAINAEVAKLGMRQQPFSVWNGSGGTKLTTSHRLLVDLALNPALLPTVIQHVPDSAESIKKPYRKPAKSAKASTGAA
jgi:hypothetical protein